MSFTFTPVPGDVSLNYLSWIFGNMNGLLPASQATTSLFAPMFQFFNNAILAVAVLVVVYTTVVGVMMTAHEGEFMKKWNSLWTPIRSVLGIAALIPTTSGYSSLQWIMMWVIIQGVGAGDMLWNTATNYVQIMGSPLGQAPSVGLTGNLQNLFQYAVCDQTARLKYQNPYGSTKNNAGNYYCQVNTQGDNGFCSSPLPTVSPSQTTVAFGPSGSCGTLTYCNQQQTCGPDANGVSQSTSLACLICTQQVNSLQQIIALFSAIGAIYATADYNYQNYIYNSSTGVPAPSWVTQYCNSLSPPASAANCVAEAVQTTSTGSTGSSPNANASTTGVLPDAGGGKPNAPPATVTQIYAPYIQSILQSSSANLPNLNAAQLSLPNLIPNAAQLYSTNATAAAMEFNKLNPQPLSAPLANATAQGWIFAGAFYFTLAQGVQTNMQQANVPLNAPASDPSSNANNELNLMRNNYASAGVLLNPIGSSGGQVCDPSSGTCVTPPTGDIAIAMASALPGQGSGNPASNPLVQLAGAGYGLLISATGLVVLALGMITGMGLLAGVNGFGLGTGLINPLFAAVTNVIMFMLPIFLMFMTVIVGCGAILGVYIPMIPYIVFTIAAIGWMMGCIETMVAGPLVALGVLAPGGHHEILGKAEPALMMLFSMFLRPTLLIFGLGASLLLASVVVVMINQMFFSVMLEIVGAGVGNANLSTGAAWTAIAFNPLELACFLCAYVGLITVSLNKCFTIIHVIPDKVLTWIGGQAAPGAGGEAEALGGVKGNIEAGAQQGGQITGEVGKQAQIQGSELQSKMQEAKGKMGGGKGGTLKPPGGG